ncbi:PEF-CTERM sorting domain-containing protein [Methanophagales archaeon]|nr:MAG: PEF-CTERM sorting domain-containing protein [Methanophagales archaeon]
MNDRRKIGTVLLAGLVVLSAMVIFATPAVAEEYDPWATDPTLDDPSLFLYIEGSTYNPSTSVDTWIAESWINPVAFSHGATYTDYVDVVADNTQNYAEDPYFFVWFKDNTLISSITVGQAQLFLNGTDQGPWGNVTRTWTTNIDCTDCPCANQFTDSTSSSCSNQPLDPNPGKHQGQTGYWVRIRIGNVPAVPDKSYGNPEDGDFDPTKLQSYVRVPVEYTLTSDTAKDLTTLIIHYDAHNNEAQSCYQSSTKNSHDASSYYVPEFSTIAIPVAAVLGLLFFFNYRKHRRND